MMCRRRLERALAHARRTLCAGSLFALFAAQPAAAQYWAPQLQSGVLDANNATPLRSSAIGAAADGYRAVAQTFRAQQSGDLVAAQLHYHFVPLFPADGFMVRLVVQIDALGLDGAPAGPIASTVVELPPASTHSSLEQIGLATATFSAPPRLTAGQQYALVVGSNATGSIGSGVLFISATPDANLADGALLLSDGAGSWLHDDPDAIVAADFAVYVVPTGP